MFIWRILKNFANLVFANIVGFAVLSANIIAPAFVFVLIWHVMKPEFYYNLFFYISIFGAIVSYAIPYYGKDYLFNKTFFGKISEEKHTRSIKDLIFDIGFAIFVMGIAYIIFSPIL